MLPTTVFVKFMQEGDESWLETYDSLEDVAEKGDTVEVGTYILTEIQSVKLGPIITKVKKVKQR